MSKLVLLLLTQLAVLGCEGRAILFTPDGAAPDAPPPDAGPPVLTAVVIEPAAPVLTVDLGAGGSRDFHAFALYSDNSRIDVTNQASWSADNDAALGGFAPAPSFLVSTSAPKGAFVARIHADYQGLRGDALLTVVVLRMTGSSTDFFFILPYNDPAGTQQKPLAFSTDIKKLDVFFAMDTTGSMLGEIQNLQSSLTGTIIPGLTGLIADTQIGVGEFQDFPVPPYGDPCQTMASCISPSRVPDQPFKLLHEVTADGAALDAAVAQMSTMDAASQRVPAGNGGDFPESQLEMLYQVATGEGISGIRLTNVPPHTSGVGGVGFREGTLRVIVTISDAIFHTLGENRTVTCHDSLRNHDFQVATDYTEPGIMGTFHNRGEVQRRLGDICARAVGVAAEDPHSGASCSPLADEEDFAGASGAVVTPASWDNAPGGRPSGCASGQCCTGIDGAGRAPVMMGGAALCPLVFRVSETGQGLGASLVAALKALVLSAPIDVTTGRMGLTSGEHGEVVPAGHTTADFLKAIVPNSATPPAGYPAPTMDAQAFHGVTPGTTVRFDVRAYNDFVPPTGQAQLFRATIRIFGDRCGTDLDHRDVFIVVPPDLVP
jgi:hypothetical protein